METYNPAERKALRGHGSRTTKTPLTWFLLIDDLRNNRMPYFDVYDSVTSSVISPLSEESVSKGSAPINIPDFTKGRWEEEQSFTLS